MNKNNPSRLGFTNVLPADIYKEQKVTADGKMFAAGLVAALVAYKMTPYVVNTMAPYLVNTVKDTYEVVKKVWPKMKYHQKAITIFLGSAQVIPYLTFAFLVYINSFKNKGA